MLLVFFLFFVCVNSQTVNLDWWKHGTFYQIYPKSFKDSDNSGIGDLQGVISKLDHLTEMGIDGVWFSPLCKSPQVDAGYDVSDYRDIDPIFGNLSDFRQLIDAAHARNIKIILDFVPNHSSNLHQWFINSENSVPGYEDYYVWVDGAANNTQPPNNWLSYFHGPAWTYSPLRNKWYLHQFAFQQPDLNYRNPAVVQEMKDILTYWLEFGVDGFRCDIVSALFEDPSFPDELNDPDNPGQLVHNYTMDLPETFDMVYQWREILDNFTYTHGGDEKIMMTENSSGLDRLFGYFGNATANAAQFAFNFIFIRRLTNTTNAIELKDIIDTWFQFMPPQYTANWVLGNHDQHRTATRYGSKKVDGFAMMELLLPGISVTYNGEEFGMENGQVTWEQGQDPQACNGLQADFDKNSRDFERTPYQWDNSTNAGFNDGTAPWLPVANNYLTFNLAMQKDPNVWSHFKVFKALVQLRKTDTLKFGSMESLAITPDVFAMSRKLAGNSTYLLVLNFADVEETVNLVNLTVSAIMNVEIPSVESSRLIGDPVDTTNLLLTPNEAIVLIGAP